MHICIRKIYRILASQIRLLALVLTDQLKLLMKLGGFFYLSDNIQDPISYPIRHNLCGLIYIRWYTSCIASNSGPHL